MSPPDRSSPARSGDRRSRLTTLSAIALVVLGLTAVMVAAVHHDGRSGSEAAAASSVPRLAGEPAVGVQFHATWTNYTDSDRARILDQLAAAGVQWVRIDIGWSGFEPDAPGVIDPWYQGRVDAAVDEARARGLQVLLTAWLTPRWANAGLGERHPPTDPADYARFLTWAADHYRGRVEAWEIWNEPNLPTFWKGDTAQYASLLEAAYPAVKAGDPSVAVVLGGPAYNDTDFLSALYDLGVQGSFDVMATHPYQGFANAPPETADDGTRGTLTHVAAVRELMVAHGDGDRPIWFTEFGWSAHPTAPGAPNWQWGVTEAAQGDYFVRTLRWVAEHAPYVTNVFWYNERAQDTGDAQLDGYGLLTHDLEPRPAYLMVQAYLTKSPSAQGAPLRFDPRSVVERVTESGDR